MKTTLMCVPILFAIAACGGSNQPANDEATQKAQDNAERAQDKADQAEDKAQGAADKAEEKANEATDEANKTP